MRMGSSGHNPRIEQDLLAPGKYAGAWWCRLADRQGSWTVGRTGGDDLVLAVVADHRRGVAGERGPQLVAAAAGVVDAEHEREEAPAASASPAAIGSAWPGG